MAISSDGSARCAQPCCPVRALKKTREILPYSSRSTASPRAANSGTASILLNTSTLRMVSAPIAVQHLVHLIDLIEAHGARQHPPRAGAGPAWMVSSSVARNAATQLVRQFADEADRVRTPPPAPLLAEKTRREVVVERGEKLVGGVRLRLRQRIEERGLARVRIARRATPTWSGCARAGAAACRAGGAVFRAAP